MSDLNKIPKENLPEKQRKKKATIKVVPVKGASTKKVSSTKKSALAPIKKHGFTISIVAFIVIVFASLFLLRGIVSVGADALANSYSVACESEKQAAYDAVYQNARDRAKEKYLTTSDVIISISAFEKSEKLEVLEANQVELITRDRDDNTDKITSWIEVSGKGTFVVDLGAAEFIVDNTHRYVLVRIPYPELTNVTITKAVKKLFKDDLWNGSYSDGVHLAVEQMNDANSRIKKALLSNQYIYKNAQSVATSMITNLVKDLNTDIPDLTVEVEFFD